MSCYFVVELFSSRTKSHVATMDSCSFLEDVLELECECGSHVPPFFWHWLGRSYGKSGCLTCSKDFLIAVDS